MSSTRGHFEHIFGALPVRPDRRACQRSNSALLTYVELGDGNGGVALNVSEGGLAIAAAGLLTSDYFPSVRFQLPRSVVWIEASGQVAWTSDSKKGAGIQFVDMADSDREKIREWIATKDSAAGSVQGTMETRGTDPEFLGIRSANKLPLKDRKLEVLSEADDAKFSVMFPSEKTLTNSHDSEEPTLDIEPRTAEQNSRNVLRFSMQSLEREEETRAPETIEHAAEELTQPETPRTPTNYIGSAENEGPWPTEFVEDNPVLVPWVAQSCEVEQQHADESELAQSEVAKSELRQDEFVKSESPQAVDLTEANPPVVDLVEETFEEKAADQRKPELPTHVFLREADLVQQLEVHRRNQAAKLLADQERESSVGRRSGWPLAALVLVSGLTCFAIGIGVGDGFFDRLLGRDQESEQRNDAAPASLTARTAGENDFAGSSAVANNAQKSKEGAPDNSAATGPSDSANTPANNSPGASNDGSPALAAGAPGEAASANGADGEKLSAKERQADDSVLTSTSPKNSAAGVTPGNSSGNSLSTDARTSGSTDERRANPETSPPQNSVAVTPVTKAQQVGTSAISPAAVVATQAAQLSETQGPILVTAPDEKSGPFKLALAEQAVSASRTLAISSQRFVSVPTQPGPASGHRPQRLQVGVLIFHADPQAPPAGNQKEMAGTVKVRATIGKTGDVIDVKPISGPAALIPAVVQAVSEWRYTVTLLDGQPLGAEEDVVVEFRPNG